MNNEFDNALNDLMNIDLTDIFDEIRKEDPAAYQALMDTLN